MAAPSTEAKFLYEPGDILLLQVHLPPQPFGNIYYEAPFNRDPLYQSPQVISQSTLQEFVFAKDMRERDESSRIPQFAKTHLDTSALGCKAAVQIIKPLSAARKKGPHVVACDVREIPAEYWQSMGWKKDGFPNKVVAKIFDPLYFPSGTTASREGMRLDVVSFADKIYAHEAASYIEIHGCRGEHLVVDESTPKYYGTFTATHKDANSTKTRQVRIVLLEYIEGTPLSDLCVVQYPAEDSSFLIPTEKAGNMKERLEVFARMLHCLVALEKIGVSRRTHSPRDILLVESEISDGRRLVITDFKHTQIVRYMKHASELCTYMPRPLHPRWRYGIDAFEEFAGWFPREWLDYEEPYFLHDAETDSDSEGENDTDDETEGAGPSFTKWANKTFIPEDFIHADETDVFAEEYEAWEVEMDKQATRHVEEMEG